jgi:hypothetical protein
MVANMDQNGFEYPAYPLGRTNTTWNPGPWYTNINASPIKDFSLSDYNDGHGGPNAAIAANMPAIEQFRADLAGSVSQAFADLGAKYGFKVPTADGDQPAYSQSDIATKSPVQDDTLGRTDQVPFVAKGIPGFGVLGAFDSDDQDNPTGSLPDPLAMFGASGIPQLAGYDTPRDNVAHFNLMTSGTPTPTSIDEPGRRALELPATWTSYLLARQKYSGAAPRPSAPIAYFEALPNDAKAGDPITFNGAASVDPLGHGLTYTWDFGDGSSGTGKAPAHTYSQAGWYDVRLVVRDATGSAIGYRQAVKVGDPATPAPQTDPCGNVSSAEVSQILGVPRADNGPAISQMQTSIDLLRFRFGKDVTDVSVDLMHNGKVVDQLAAAPIAHAGVPYTVRYKRPGLAGTYGVRLTADTASGTVSRTRSAQL